MPGDAGDETAEARIDVAGNDVADGDAADDADGRLAVAAAAAVAETQEDRRVRNVAQREIRDGDILEYAAVDGLEREAAAVFEHAVGNRDVPEAAEGFGAELDASGRTAAMGERAGLRAEGEAAGRALGSRFREIDAALAGAVEQRADVVAAHEAVGDRNVFRGARIAERRAALEADAVVERRVHAAIGNADVAATVEVHAVALRVDRDVVNGEVVHAADEDGEVAALEEGEIAEEDVAAAPEGDALVAGARRHAGRAHEAFAENPAGPDDRDVLEIQSGDEAVAPVAVAEVRELLGFRRDFGLGRIEGETLVGRGFQDGAGPERERDPALEPDRNREISAGREVHDAAPGGLGRGDRRMDRVGVERAAVAAGAETGDVEKSGGRRHGRGKKGLRGDRHGNGRGANTTHHASDRAKMMPGPARATEAGESLYE